MSHDAPMTVRVTRIIAHDPDGEESFWRSLMDADPDMTERHVSKFLNGFPHQKRRQQVVTTTNSLKWPSTTMYMVAMSEDEDATRIAYKGSAAVDDGPDHRLAEMAEMTRDPTIFAWVRPLQTLGTHVILGGCTLDDECRSCIRREIGEVTFLGDRSFLTEEWPNDVERRLSHALKMKLTGHPRW